MINLPLIRAAITDTLNGLDVGQFYKSQRVLKNSRELTTEFGTNVKGGFIELVKRKEIDPYEGRNQRFYTWRVTYFTAIKDDSQEEFEDATESIADVFGDDPTLGGTVDDTRDEDRNAVTLEGIEPVMYMGVLCHRARMLLVTEVYS